jgi:rhodanese-related sulfurtransferase
MKKRVWALVAFVMPVLWGCGQPSREPEIPSIEPAQLKQMIDGKETFSLINAMSSLECLDRSIPGSLCIPDEEFDARAPQLLPDKGRRLVFYCESDRCLRSSEEAAKAKRLGYTEVWVLRGGMPSWKAAGYGTVSEERITRVPVESVKPDRLAQWITEKRPLLILDVRREEQFAADHLPGAVNIPLYRIHERYPEIPLDRTVVVVDERGLRSFLVSSYLVRKGIVDVKRLFKGMEGWRTRRDPVHFSQTR